MSEPVAPPVLAPIAEPVGNSTKPVGVRVALVWVAFVYAVIVGVPLETPVSRVLKALERHIDAATLNIEKHNAKHYP